MRRIDAGDPERLTYREGGGCMALFGLPFLCMGLFVVVMALGGSLKGGSGQAAGAIMGTLMGGLFACVGAAFVFGRAGLVLDRPSRTISRWWGFLSVPLYTKNYGFQDFTSVTLTREQRRSKNSTYTVYPVRLVGREKVNLEASRSDSDGRRLAEEIAGFLSIDLVDSLTGAPVTRKPETLNESLRDRAQRTGEDVAITAPPPGLRSKVSAEGNRVIIDIPPAPLSAAVVGPLIGVVLFELFVIFVFFLPIVTDANMPSQMKLIFGLLLGVFFIATPILTALGAFAKKASSRTVVEADPQGLRVRTRGLLFGKTEQIPANELEELRFDQKNCLAAMSDKKTLRFGEGLPREEQDWLRRIILKAVTTADRAAERVDSQ